MLENREGAMTEPNAEPVEISTRMRPQEWTEESLAGLTASYQRKVQVMGAPAVEIVTEVETPDDGSARVRVSWLHSGVHTFADLNQSEADGAHIARGDGEIIPPGEASKDSKGVGAVLGDAEWSAIDAPPTERAVEAEKNEQIPNIVIYTNIEGKSYAEEVDEKRAE
jgi:hypothetical protein